MKSPGDIQEHKQEVNENTHIVVIWRGWNSAEVTMTAGWFTKVLVFLMLVLNVTGW